MLPCFMHLPCSFVGSIQYDASLVLAHVLWEECTQGSRIWNCMCKQIGKVPGKEGQICFDTCLLTSWPTFATLFPSYLFLGIILVLLFILRHFPSTPLIFCSPLIHFLHFYLIACWSQFTREGVGCRDAQTMFVPLLFALKGTSDSAPSC